MAPHLKAAAALACLLGAAQAHFPAAISRENGALNLRFDISEVPAKEPALMPFPEPAQEPVGMIEPAVGMTEPCVKHLSPDMPVRDDEDFPLVDPVCKYDYAKYCSMYMGATASHEGQDGIGNFYTATTEIFLAAARRLQVLPAEEPAAAEEPATTTPRKPGIVRLRERLHRMFHHEDVSSVDTSSADDAAGAPEPADVSRVNGHLPRFMRDKPHHSLSHWHQHEGRFEDHHFHKRARHERNQDDHHSHRHRHGHGSHGHGHLRAGNAVAAVARPLIALAPPNYPYPFANPLGANSDGEMCMRAHLEQLSPECRQRIESYDQMLSEGSQSEDYYEDMQEHHPSVIGAWVSAVFWVALSTWICKRSKSRLARHEQVRAVLDTVRDSAELKAAVESQTGVEVPQVRKLNSCCFYLAPGLIAFWAALVTIGAICATGRYFAEEDPEAGETFGWVMIGVVSTLIVVLAVAFARRTFCSSSSEYPAQTWRYVYNSNPGYIALTGMGASAPSPGSPEVYTGVPVQPPPGAVAARGYNPPNVI